MTIFHVFLGNYFQGFVANITVINSALNVSRLKCVSIFKELIFSLGEQEPQLIFFSENSGEKQRKEKESEMGRRQRQTEKQKGQVREIKITLIG